MSIDKDQLRELIIRPTLEELDLWSPEAEDLLMGTAAVESNLGQISASVNLVGGSPWPEDALLGILLTHYR